MKKLILLAILLFGTMIFAQDTPFVRKYVSVIEEGQKQMRAIDLTVVFNYKSTKDLVFFFPDRQTYLYRTSNITKGKTEGGYQYQLFDAVISENGQDVTIQLFDTAMRVFIDGNYIEYHEE